MSAPRVFDRPLLRRRRRRAHALGAATFLIDRAAADLAERLSAVLHRFAVAADLGSPTDAVRRALGGMVDTLIAVDAAPEHVRAHAGPRVVADEEALPFADGSLDLVVSALALQSVDDLPGSLVQVRRALKPDGYFLAALLGCALAHRAAPELRRRRGGPRERGFAARRALHRCARCRRAAAARGVCAAGRRRRPGHGALRVALCPDGGPAPHGSHQSAGRAPATPLRRATLMRMAETYAARFADADGRVRASFDIVWLSGWAPHPDQPQPLKPGSAQMRLADALGTREIPTGEKPER